MLTLLLVVVVLLAGYFGYHLYTTNAAVKAAAQAEKDQLIQAAKNELNKL